MEIMVNTIAAPPMTAPIRSGLFSPKYRAIRTVIPIANWITTKVTRLSTWLPVETAESPDVEPNLPTTRRSTAPYAACRINAPRTGIIKATSFFKILPCVKSALSFVIMSPPLAHDLVKFLDGTDHTVCIFF